MGLQHRLVFGAMKGALRVFYPPQCVGCGEPVGAVDDSDAPLCPACWRETRFITGAACHRCGVPLPDGGEPQQSRAQDLTCDDCLTIARPWQRGCGAMVYSGTGRRMVLALKHGDRPDLAPALAGWLARAARPLVTPDTIVVPVPLHLRRLLRRRYNQAALVAAHLARRMDLSHAPGLLHRHRHTPAQDHRTADDRFANLTDAMTVPARHRDRLRGRRVLLVDDVMASGATMAAATDALLAAGAADVSVAVLARAVKDD